MLLDVAFLLRAREDAFPPFDAAAFFAARDCALEAGPRREVPDFLVVVPPADALPPLEAAAFFFAREPALEAGPLREVPPVLREVALEPADLEVPDFDAVDFDVLALVAPDFEVLALAAPDFEVLALEAVDFDVLLPALAVDLLPVDFAVPLEAFVLAAPILPATDFFALVDFDVDFLAVDLSPPLCSPVNAAAIFSRSPCGSLLVADFLLGLGLLACEQLQSAAPACINFLFLGSIVGVLLEFVVCATTTPDISGSQTP